MSCVKLLIDNRERWTHEFVGGSSGNIFDFEYRQLDLGDFVVSANEVNVLYIERKTVADIIQSIKDGRYKDQLCRYKSIDCKVLYIIEGVNGLTDLSMFGSSSADTAATNIMIRYGFPVMFCKTKRDTFRLINDIMCRVVKNPEKYLQKDIDSDAINTRKTKKNGMLTPEMLLANMIACIPGVSIPTAMDIVEAYEYPHDMKSLSERMCENKEKLLSLKLKSGRKVGKNVVESVKNMVCASIHS